MIKFSLILATRKRTVLLKDLLNSIKTTSSFPKEIEIVIVYDNDDEETKSNIKIFENIICDFKFKFIERKRSSNLNNDYINFAASHSTGKYIFILNDDVVFLSKDWDEKAFVKLEDYVKENNIVYGLTDDGMEDLKKKQRLKYTGFPIISRHSFNTLGYAMHPDFKGWGADIHLYDLYSSISRVCDLTNEVKLLHVSPHCQLRPEDEINKHVASISNVVKTNKQEELMKFNKTPKIKIKENPKINVNPSQVNNTLPNNYLRRIKSIQKRK